MCRSPPSSRDSRPPSQPDGGRDYGRVLQRGLGCQGHHQRLVGPPPPGETPSLTALVALRSCVVWLGLAALKFKRTLHISFCIFFFMILPRAGLQNCSHRRVSDYWKFYDQRYMSGDLVSVYTHIYTIYTLSLHSSERESEANHGLIHREEELHATVVFNDGLQLRLQGKSLLQAQQMFSIYSLCVHFLCVCLFCVSLLSVSMCVYCLFCFYSLGLFSVSILSILFLFSLSILSILSVSILSMLSVGLFSLSILSVSSLSMCLFCLFSTNCSTGCSCLMCAAVGREW